MSKLKKTIEDLASNFALGVIEALRTVSIDELTGVGRSGLRGIRTAGVPASAVDGGSRRGGRLGRRSPGDIGRMVENIVDLLQTRPEGLRAEQIREALAVEAKELPRPLADGLAAGRIRKEGQKRATTYFFNQGSFYGEVKGRRGRRRARARA